MQIEEKRIVIDSTWFSLDREVRRSKGLHLSHVLNFIEDGGVTRKPEQRSNSLNNFAAGGFLWERVLEKLIELSPEDLFSWLFTGVMNEIPNPKVVRPGEMCVDGIYLTPDGYCIEDQILEEYKHTSKSANTDLNNEKFSRWVQWQIPSYLNALRLLKCRLRVYFVRGDYRSPEPIWKEFILTYTQQEIDEIWGAVRLNAAYMREHGLVDHEAI